MFTKSAVTALLLANTQAKVQDTATAVKIVEGLLKGAIDAEGFSDIDSCIKDVETLAADAKVAIADFEKKDAADVLAGLKEVAQMITVVKSGMQDCSHIQADWEKLVKMATVFSSPTDFAYHVGKDLIVNKKQIFSEVNTAVTDYKSEDWFGFGYNMGEAAAKTLLGAEQQRKFQVAEIMQGVIKAFGGHFNLEALLACVGEEDKAALIFNAAYGQFKKAAEDKDIKEALPGVILVVAGLKQAQQGLPACEAVDTNTWDFAGLQHAESLMSHPTENFEIIGEDLLINGVSILKDIEVAFNEYKNGQFEKFGETIGNIVKLATKSEIKEYPHQEWMQKRIPSAPASKLDKKDITSVVQGFFEGTNVGTFNFTALLECIYSADQEAEVLDTGVHMLIKAYEDKSVQEAIPAVIAGIAFVQGLKQTIPICMQVDQSSFNWTTFDQIVSIVESPEKHMRAIDENIVLNGKTITNEMFNAFEDWRSGDYFNFGKNIGTTLKDTCEPEHSLFLY